MNKLIKYIIESRFNFNIDLLDIEDNEGDFSLSKQLYKSKSMKQEYFENIFVDLGLPSGTLWCKYNLGCNFNLLNYSPESTSPKDWYGDYYAWGEIEPNKKEYSLETYKYANNGKITKYNDFDNFDVVHTLEKEDDAAYLANNAWKTPDIMQINELLNETDHEDIKNYEGVSGLNGKLFKSKTNGNCLFIPYAGYFGHYRDMSELEVEGYNGYIWSSTKAPDHSKFAFFVEVSNNGCVYEKTYRWYGFSIRPILVLDTDKK